MDHGYENRRGLENKCFLWLIACSYELKENLFIELNALVRKQDTKTTPITSKNTTAVSLGVRWNMHRRELDY
jgi:hypothetical protein